MKKPIRLAALAAAGALAVGACGGAGSGENAGAEGNGTDRAFVAAMIPHHESAVDMGEIAQRSGESEFVRELADEIVRTQSAEIAELRRADQELEAAGVEKGSLDVPEHARGMHGDPAELRGAQPFDEAFLRMMIPHHEGAVRMAEAELADGADPDLKALAERIIEAQEAEIEQMREHLGQDDAGHGTGH